MSFETNGPATPSGRRSARHPLPAVSSRPGRRTRRRPRGDGAGGVSFRAAAAHRLHRPAAALARHAVPPDAGRRAGRRPVGLVELRRRPRRSGWSGRPSSSGAGTSAAPSSSPRRRPRSSGPRCMRRACARGTSCCSGWSRRRRGQRAGRATGSPGGRVGDGGGDVVARALAVLVRDRRRGPVAAVLVRHLPRVVAAVIGAGVVWATGFVWTYPVLLALSVAVSLVAFRRRVVAGVDGTSPFPVSRSGGELRSHLGHGGDQPGRDRVRVDAGPDRDGRLPAGRVLAVRVGRRGVPARAVLGDGDGERVPGLDLGGRCGGRATVAAP